MLKHPCISAKKGRGISAVYVLILQSQFKHLCQVLPACSYILFSFCKLFKSLCDGYCLFCSEQLEKGLTTAKIT